MSGSTRVAAIRLSTEDLDAARGKFEALGSLGDQVLDRITQAGQRASAAMSGIAGPDDAFARRAADIAAYGAGLDRLQASFNPLFGTMRRYETTLADIAQAERVGAIASGEAVVARQRAFASYEQQISANAGLAESYSQLGIAMIRLVDVQQAANRGAGVAAPLAGEALAARGADVAAYGAELDRLRAKFDPLFAVSRTYETTLAEIAQAEWVGAISATVAARAREAATKAFADAAAPTGVAASATAVLAGKTVEAAKQQEALGVSAGANAFALRQLGVQTMQAVSSIAAGQPVMMTMIQQGHQVADVAMSTGTGFGVLGTAARMVAGALLSPVGAAVAVGGAFALAMAHAAALETEARQLSVALRAVGRDGDLATASLQGYILTLQHAGVARDAAAAIVQGLARVPALGNAQIQQVVGLTADTTAALGGTDQAAVAKRLGEIASGSYTALKSLDDELNLLTADQHAAIRVMLEHGERTEAVAKAMEALRLRVHGLDQDALSPAAKAVRALGNEWSTLMDRIAQSGPIQAALVVLTAVGAAANKLLEAEPPVATIDRRVGQIDTKLAERDSYGAPVVTGDAERILRRQRADLLAIRMLAGGQVQGGAASAPDPPAPPAGAIGAAEAERQKKQLEDINKALADQQRILAAGLPDRVRVKAEIEAEAYIREHALTGLAAEEYLRKAVTLALASETDARGQELAGILRAETAQMAMVRAAEEGRAAMLRATAAAEAHEQAATKTGVSEIALAAAILNRNAAQEAAKGAQTVVELNEQIGATKALIAAEQSGDRAAYYAKIDDKVRQVTLSARAYRDAATDPAVKAALTALIVLMGQKVELQEKLNADLDTERALRAGQGQLDDLRAEAALIGQSAEQRERELAALRTIRGLITAGKAPDAASLTETQQALVEQSKAIASANYALKQQQSLYDGIANAASQAFDQVGTAIANAFVSGQRAAINWGNVASSIISSVLQQVLKLAVINPVLNSVLGTSMPAASRSGLSGGGGSIGGSGLFSGLGSLFGGSGSASGFMATPLWGADVAGPVTAGGITASGAPTLGAMFGGVGAGFGAGMLLNSLVGGNQLGGTIGSGVGAMAGAAIGSIIPGIGTLIGGLIGGAAGGGLGGMFGPGPKHHGWSWTLGSDDAGMIGFRTANVDPVAQQQFAQEQQQVGAFNTWMQQSGMKAAGAYIVGGNNDPNLEHDYASFAAGFSNLRFSAANDNRLNTALSGRAFTDPNQLADFTTFLTQTMAILEKAPLNDFATALKGVNDTYDAAIKKAQDYALAEGDLTAERDRRIADLTARRDLQASSLTAGLQVRYLRATGGTEQADLLAFDTAAAQERQQMTDQILAMGLASTQYAADRMVDIEKTLAAERLAIQEKYAADSKRASQSLLTELTIGNQSALAPEQRYFAGLSLLNDARHSLDAGGALSDFTAVAQQVLPVARDFLGTSERYAALVAEVAGAVASKGGDPAGLSTLLQAQVDGTDALRDVFARYGDQQLTVASATLSELRRLASVLEALMARSLAA